jgi:hypothetical protein
MRTASTNLSATSCARVDVRLSADAAVPTVALSHSGELARSCMRFVGHHNYVYTSYVTYMNRDTHECSGTCDATQLLHCPRHLKLQQQKFVLMYM